MNRSINKRIQKLKDEKKDLRLYSIDYVLEKLKNLTHASLEITNEKIEDFKKELQEWEYFLGHNDIYLKNITQSQDIKIVDSHSIELSLKEIFNEELAMLLYNIIVKKDDKKMV